MANLSKIKIGGTVYNLKDAEARAKLVTLLGSQSAYDALNQALGSAAWLGADSEVSETTAAGTGVATTKAVKSYVDAQIGTINSFDVVIDKDGTADGPSKTASADTMYQLYMVQDNTAAAGTYIEWITVRSGSGTEADPYTYVWEKIGSTKADLTGYVPVERTIAGIDLKDDITAAEVKTALGLHNLAYANTASGKVASQTISDATATGTPEGEIAVTLTQTSTTASLTKAAYTPAGTITGSAISGGSIDVTLKDATATTAADISYGAYTPAGTVAITKSETGTFQVAGTNDASAVTITPSKDTAIKSLKDGNDDAATLDTTKFNGGSKAADSFTANTVATWTGNSYTAPSLGTATTDKFNTDGIKGHIATEADKTADSSVDDETLVFEAASTADAVTAQGTFSAGSLDWGTFNGGTAATFTEGAFTAASLSDGFFSAKKLPVAGDTIDAWTGYTAATAAAQTFTGSKYTPSFTGTEESELKATKVEYTKQEVDTKTFTPTDATLGFSGTEVKDFQVTGVNYDKATVNTATFTGKSSTFDVSDITVTEKTVQVTPDAVSD